MERQGAQHLRCRYGARLDLAGESASGLRVDQERKTDFRRPLRLRLEAEPRVTPRWRRDLQPLRGPGVNLSGNQPECDDRSRIGFDSQNLTTVLDQNPAE